VREQRPGNADCLPNLVLTFHRSRQVWTFITMYVFMVQRATKWRVAFRLKVKLITKSIMWFAWGDRNMLHYDVTIGAHVVTQKTTWSSDSESSITRGVLEYHISSNRLAWTSLILRSQVVSYLTSRLFRIIAKLGRRYRPQQSCPAIEVMISFKEQHAIT
jgi:hypothetical protein